MFSANTTQVSSAINYIEDVFSTWLYTGTGNTLTVTNGIDLSGKGGLVWAKDRTFANENNRLYDTTRGVDKVLFSNATNASSTVGDLSSFNSNGFTVASAATSNINYAPDNPSPHDYVTWTFREQPKFFDVVTYTGNNTTQNISHSLGSTPGCVIVKRTDGAASWFVWHRGQSAGYYSILNTTPAQTNANSAITFGNNTTYVDPTSTQFTVGSNGNVNGLGNTYVAYIFAHNAGGFGLTGTDNVISCGSFTTDGSANATVSLGYEPQWVMIKSSSNTGNWFVIDNMRNFSQTVTASLSPNLSNAEAAGFGDATYSFFPTATGFQSVQDLAASQTYIYIAIRRGPMKVPTVGTSVFKPTTTAGTGVVVNTGFPVDLNIYGFRSGNINSQAVNDRLRGVTTTPTQASSPTIKTASTDAENTGIATVSWNNTGFTTPTSLGVSLVNWSFRRAPSFFDEVCYTGAFPSNVTVNHNLGVTPEFIITKARSTAGYDWRCYHSALGIGTTIRLNLTNAASAGTQYVSVSSTNFVVGNSGDTDNNGTTYVSYLFATCAGVSKVGSYTGTGTTLQINCGFTAGARFVLIKRTSSTGDWYVWDSARGIIAGNDPYLRFNTDTAEVTNTDYVDTYSAGFEISSTAPAAINGSGGTFIFLAIA